MNSILNVLLTAGVISIIADAIITSVRAAAARKRELKGLLRMLYVEQPRPFFLPLFTSFAEGGFSESHIQRFVYLPPKSHQSAPRHLHMVTTRHVSSSCVYKLAESWIAPVCHLAANPSCCGAVYKDAGR
jgi:hypothetical protein